MLAVGAAGIVGLAHKDAAAQGGAGGNDHTLAGIVAVQIGVDAGDVAVPDFQAHDLGLVNVQVGGQLQRMLHVDMVTLAVGLHPQTVHRGTLAPVEHPALQKGGVGGNAHQAAQGVDLPHQVALGGAADGGVAGHVADKVQRQCKDGGLCAQRCRRMGGFDAGVAGTDYNYVVTAKMVDQNDSSFQYCTKQKCLLRYSSFAERRNKKVLVWWGIDFFPGSLPGGHSSFVAERRTKKGATLSNGWTTTWGPSPQDPRHR